MDIASISPHYYCKFGNTARLAQQGLWTIISRVETETEIPSLQVAEQGKWRGREGKCNQAPHNVNTGDRALIGVQHSPIQLYLTTSSITASLSLKSQMSAWWRCTHLHIPRAPNTSALLPCWSLTNLPLTMEMDASPGTSPNLVLWLSCFADLTTFENNTEVSACAFKEGQR